MRHIDLHLQLRQTRLFFSHRKCPSLILWIMLALFAWSLASPATAMAQETVPSQPPIPPAPFQPGRLLVGVDPNTSIEAITASLLAQGLTIRRIYPDFHLIEVTIPAAEVAIAQTDAATATQAAQAAVRALPGVTYVDLDYLVQLAQDSPATETTTSPGVDDPLIDQQWALAKIGAPAAWQIAHGSADFAVAILDSGYDSQHPDLPDDRLWRNMAEVNGRANVDDDDNGYVDDFYGWDWIDEDNEPNDFHGHGTHVFGIISAAADNGIGIAGLGPDLRVAPLRVLDANGFGSLSYLIAALDYARIMGFRIANLSLTVNADFSSLHNAILAADHAGMIVLAAPGNTGGSTLWPAAYPQVVAVAATTESDTRADFSNTGPEIDLAAPGRGILSTYLHDVSAYRPLSGTSMAVPHVAAAAALVWSLRPDLSSNQVVDHLKATAVDINQATLPGPDSDIGAGRLDLAAAITHASENLRLVDTSHSPHLALSSTSIAIPIAVRPIGANNLAVSGAVIRYRLYDEQDRPLGSEARTLTGANGIGELTLDTPAQAGLYHLRASVGAAAPLDVPLTVHTRPINLKIALARTESQAGGQPVAFTVQLSNGDEELETIPLPVRLETSLGSFDPSSLVQSQEITVAGIYAGQLYPGTRAGTATLTASMGDLSDQDTLTVVPGPAATVLGPSDGLPVTIIAANRLALTFLIQDAHGNPVADDTLVNFESTEGTLNPTSAQTVGGQVHTELTVTDNVSGQVSVRVTVPDTALDARVEVYAIHRYFAPILRIP